MTSEHCSQLQAFADGMLSVEQERTFGEHLADCTRCQAELTGLFQLEQLGRRHVEEHGPVEVPWYLVAQNRRKAIGGLIIFTLTLLLTVVGVSRLSPAPSAYPLWERGTRHLEARVTYPPADRYRPLASTAMGSKKSLAPSTYSASIPAELEQRGDLQQLVAVYLAAGDPHPKDASAVLERMKTEGVGDISDVLCDLGAARYAERDDWEALRLFNEALSHKPTHVQALWNRALVYRRVGLPLLAREGFKEVERTDKDEGWRRAAQEEAEQLDDVLLRKKKWLEAEKAGEALVAGSGSAIETALRFRGVPMMRRDFYDAVRTRGSAEEVRALRPLAEQLDGQAGAGTVLVDYLESIAASDFTQRAPWARLYARLVSGQISSDELKTLLPGLLASKENDIALGVLVRTHANHPEYSAEFIKRTENNKDTWFKLLSQQFQAKQKIDKKQYRQAKEILESALNDCMNARLFYRCIDIENDLSHALAWLFQIDEAEQHASEGLRLARKLSQWDKEGVLLMALGNVARMTTKVPQGRAYYAEALRVLGDDAEARLNIHQNLAHLAIQSLELDEARAQLDQAMDIGLPLTIHGVEALVDVARTRHSARDTTALEESLALEDQETVGQRAYTSFLRGRFIVEIDPERGRNLLEESIREAAKAGPEDPLAPHARAYSYTSLIFADAQQGDYLSALHRFGDERGFEAPDKCVLAVTEDTERSLLVARGADRRLLSDYQPMRQHYFPTEDLSGIVPREIVDALEPCNWVDVLARPPLENRAGLLPSDIAWGYRMRIRPPQQREGPALHLVVNDVQYEKGVDPLRWKPHPGSNVEVRILRGLDATPSRVLKEMEHATEIDLATHGLSSPVATASYLLLARDVDGSNKLNEESIRKIRLTGAPLVILAACEAARGTSALHESKSLPNAFLTAGARGVIAATQKIPDKESSIFFGEVRERIRGGAPIRVAVRDVRKKWMDEGQGADWLNGILVFE
ncbi:CHAT domain-containing protein [Cystobacter ferrugineus]|uniref:CHAT domain-containing protein n=1 Tax=Cystobacter ferrugineus TaxID=83449 RepID=A0A1L9AV87_9BACT|nr:CHAT domain-containing protein [Cystobacter ferrugineus]OJH33904.1 hypothetical protein BON30_46100 [Cystobacter ferrugineus]